MKCQETPRRPPEHEVRKHRHRRSGQEAVAEQEAGEEAAEVGGVAGLTVGMAVA